MPGPPGSGVTSPARRNRTRPINRLSPVTPLDGQDVRLITEMGTIVKCRLVIRDGAKVVIRGLDPRIHGDDVPARTRQLNALSPEFRNSGYAR